MCSRPLTHVIIVTHVPRALTNSILISTCVTNSNWRDGTIRIIRIFGYYKILMSYNKFFLSTEVWVRSASTWNLASIPLAEASEIDWLKEISIFGSKFFFFFWRKIFGSKLKLSKLHKLLLFLFFNATLIIYVKRSKETRRS